VLTLDADTRARLERGALYVDAFTLDDPFGAVRAPIRAPR
jgi:hypothetical protein